MSKLFTSPIFRVILLLVGLWLAFELVANLIVEILWFQELGYLSVFLKRLLWKVGLWGITTSLSIAFLSLNLRLAQRLKWHIVPEKTKPGLENISPGKILPQSYPIRLPWLLAIVLGFGLLIGLMLLYFGEVALDVWTPDFTLPNIIPPLPSPFKVTSALPQISQNLGKLAIIVLVPLAILINSHFWLSAIAGVVSLVMGLTLAGNWTRVLEYFSPTVFEGSDPQFGRDISFYIFKLPVWNLLDFWLGGLFLYGLIAVSLTYLLSGDSLSQGKFAGFSRPQLHHLYGLGGLMVATLGLHHWLERYQLLYSRRGVSYGANYTDVRIQLPLETALAILACAIAVWLLVKTATGRGNKKPIPKGRHFQSQSAPAKLAKLPFSPLPFVLYLALLILGAIATQSVQSLVVQPNELERERPYIERSIAFTRAAFALDTVEVKSFAPEGELTAADLQENDLTIDNIRLWDTRPLLQTNRQLQQIRLYYKFPDADIDRYTFAISTEGEKKGISPTKQQVIIAARELDYSAVPDRAKTWVNEHLIYTHGYGFTLSPVNRVGEGGLPDYFVKDIGTDTEEGALQISDKILRGSIPIGKPRIYYGELSNTYVMANTKVKELDFPSGQENAYNTYDGTGGIEIGSFGRRLLFAQYLKDWQMLFTTDFTPETRLLFRRNINRRIREIAPFLYFDRDPYLVVADAGDVFSGKPPNYLYWIVDAYTTSDRYPYSDPGDRDFNYIRNSVKIVVDAYNGDVNFYIADPDDPIIQTWRKIFPRLFKPLAAMPANLRGHIRYPQDLYSTQSEALLTYHMTDAQVFYNREDQWRIPQEIYGTEEQAVEPYYLIMKFPGGTAEEFVLLHPYTPKGRNNLIATLFGRSDGEEYGKLLLYKFPKQRLIYGPEQLEALINQDPAISQQISLWNRQGSRVIQGNLLVIPIEQSLLYIEPLYLEAEQNSLPTFVRVIVVYENRIVMAETLNRALEAIFQTDRSPNSTIIRELDRSDAATPALPNPDL